MSSGEDDRQQGWVSWRDFYTELEKVSTRVGRIEKFIVALLILTASPKLGGPSAPQILTAIFGG